MEHYAVDMAQWRFVNNNAREWKSVRSRAKLNRPMNIYEEIYPLNLITNDDNYLELMIFQSEINLVNYKT